MEFKIDNTYENGEILIFDSSFLFALINKKDSLHNEALKFKYLMTEMRILPDFIILEVATILRNKVSEEMSINFVNSFTDTEGVQIKSFFEYFGNFCGEFTNLENKKLSFVDASLLALHKTGKYKIITFDKNLEQQIKKFDQI